MERNSDDSNELQTCAQKKASSNAKQIRRSVFKIILFTINYKMNPCPSSVFK